MSLKRLIYILLLLFLFFLPWQARVVYVPATLGGQFWEYGSLSWYATEVLLWVIIIFSAFERFRQKSFWARVASREHFQKHRFQLFFGIAIFLYALGQIVWSVNQDISYQWLFHLLEGLCLFVIIEEQAGEGRAFQIAFWAGGVGQGVLALWQFFSQAVTHTLGSGIALQAAARLGSFVIETGGERWLRAYGAFGSPNILGGYLAVVFVVGLRLYLQSTPRQKIFFTAGQMVVLIGLVLSFSRGAWVAAGVGVLTIVILNEAKRSKESLSQSPNGQGSFATAQDDSEAREDIIKQLVFSFFIILTLFFVFRPLFITRFTPSARLEIRSLTERVGQYRDALPIFQEYWLMGVGPGAYTVALFKKHPAWPVWDIQPVHNIYLLLLAELGAVGFVLFFWWCFFIARHILESNWRWLSVLLTLLVLGLFDHWLQSLYVGQMVWWTVLALGFGENKKTAVCYTFFDFVCQCTGY